MDNIEHDGLDTKNKIISTAVDMIGRHSDLNITTREIAKNANVNLAAINYYFRTKENLFNEVESYFVKKTRAIYDELLKSDLGPREKITTWALKTMEHLIEFPGILFLLATKLIKGKGKNPGISKMIDDFENSLTPMVSQLFRSDDEEFISFKVIQLLSGVITPVLIYHVADKTLDKEDIIDDAVRRRYIDNLVNSVI